MPRNTRPAPSSPEGRCLSDVSAALEELSRRIAKERDETSRQLAVTSFELRYEARLCDHAFAYMVEQGLFATVGEAEDEMAARMSREDKRIGAGAYGLPQKRTAS